MWPRLRTVHFGRPRTSTVWRFAVARTLGRVAAALRELHARLRVEGLSDDEAAALPMSIDADILGRLEISTWRTDAGDVDVLTDLPARDGRRLDYAALSARADRLQLHGATVSVAALDDVIASKEWADRPKDREALPELRGLASGGASDA